MVYAFRKCETGLNVAEGPGFCERWMKEHLGVGCTILRKEPSVPSTYSAHPRKVCSDFSWTSPRLPDRGHRRQGILTESPPDIRSFEVLIET